MNINEYYKSLSVKERREFKTVVLDKTGMQYPTFDMKRRKDSWNKLEREAVERIICDRRIAHEVPT